ncbi:MAG: cell division protein FtsA [Alistipes sp.]|nr:cell division protein FtsA [Alistipes sp.]
MEKKNYVVAVDLGSTAVVVGVAAKAEDGTMEIQALVSKPVKGVAAGRIENIEDVSSVLGKAFEEAGQQAGIRITSAYAGISGDFVRCARHTDYVFVADPKNGVSKQDLVGLFDRMRNLQAPDDETIMERIPQNYVIDQNQEVQNPIGSFGAKLSSTFNFILCQRTPIQRLEMALKRVGVELLGVIPNSLATAEAVLSADEKEEGVAVVDVGGGVTDVTVYYRNIVRYVASIPIGASAINHDIRTMGVPERFVENLKQKYGSAVSERVSEEKLIRVTGRTPRESRDILLRNLSTVIEARTMDIIDLVNEELKISGYAGKLGYGIVLTGGSANLKDIDELFRLGTKLDVRVAQPDMNLTEESCAMVNDPTYATVVGLLMRGSTQSQIVLPPTARPAVVTEPVSKVSVASQPAQPAQPVVKEESKPQPQPQEEKPAQPVQSIEQKPYVPPVVPASEVVDNEPEEEEEEIYEEQPNEKGGFWGWVKKITEKFETPGDEEI